MSEALITPFLGTSLSYTFNLYQLSLNGPNYRATKTLEKEAQFVLCIIAGRQTSSGDDFQIDGGYSGVAIVSQSYRTFYFSIHNPEDSDSNRDATLILSDTFLTIVIEANIVGGTNTHVARLFVIS